MMLQIIQTGSNERHVPIPSWKFEMIRMVGQADEFFVPHFTAFIIWLPAEPARPPYQPLLRTS